MAKKKRILVKDGTFKIYINMFKNEYEKEIVTNMLEKYARDRSLNEKIVQYIIEGTLREVNGESDSKESVKIDNESIEEITNILYNKIKNEINFNDSKKEENYPPNRIKINEENEEILKIKRKQSKAKLGGIMG